MEQRSPRNALIPLPRRDSWLPRWDTQPIGCGLPPPPSPILQRSPFLLWVYREEITANISSHWTYLANISQETTYGGLWGAGRARMAV